MSGRETTPHGSDVARHVRDDASTDALPVAPALGASLDAARMPRRSTLVEPRILFIAGLAIALGIAAALVAQLLVALIAVVTNLAFHGRWSLQEVSPATHQLGAWVIVVPVIVGLILGL